jgi:hypothetical protein
MIEMGQRSVSNGAPVEDAPGGGAALASVRARLRDDFPLVPPEHIDALLTEFFGRTRGARVQTFRVLLADRDARAALRSYSSPPPGNDAGASSEDLEGAR